MPTADLAHLRALRDRLCAAKGSNRPLDYELFRVFTATDAGGFWDPAAGNDFTSWPAVRRCAAMALSAQIAELEAADHG